MYFRINTRPMSVRLLYQDDGVGADTLLASGKAEALGCRRLDGYIVLVNADNLGKTSLYRRHMGIYR